MIITGGSGAADEGGRGQGPHVLSFFCTHCGIELEIGAETAGFMAQCPRCGIVVRTPPIPTALVDEVTQAWAAVDVAPGGPAAVPVPTPYALSYLPAWAERYEHSEALEQIARCLQSISTAEEEEPDESTNCGYCGSTIARFMRKCPYCRHALWGV